MQRAFSTSEIRPSTFKFPQPTSRITKLRQFQGADVMRFRNVLLLLTFLVATVVTAAPSTAFAQTETGRITGTVSDPSGLVVPGATVTLTSTTSGALRTTTTDSVGRYVIANAQPASDTLKAELSGFARQ